MQFKGTSYEQPYYLSKVCLIICAMFLLLEKLYYSGIPVMYVQNVQLKISKNGFFVNGRLKLHV